WRKGEQSGHIQEVRAIFINCEENSLLIRVVQHGDAACHEGYRSCYYRRLQPDDTYETIAERLFDPTEVYAGAHSQQSIAASHEDALVSSSSSSSSDAASLLETLLHQLYGVYTYLRDH